MVPAGLQRGYFTGERGMPCPCRGWKSLQSLGKLLCLCVSCLTMCPTVFVCTVYSHYEQKAQVRDTERKEMHDLPTALWCMLLKKNSLM